MDNDDMDVFNALSEPVRRSLLDALRHGPRNVNELVALTGSSQPVVSKHLKILRTATLVKMTPQGQRRIYEIEPEGILKVDAWLAPYRALWANRLGKVGQLEDGRYIVSYERRLNAPIETVWHAITDPVALSQWFPEVRLDPREGGAFTIHFTDASCTGPADVQGEVTTCSPPHILHFGSMRFELKSEADGGCTLYFSDVLQFERGRSPSEVTNSVLAGWHQFMDRIETHLEGGHIDFTANEIDYRELTVAGRELIPD